MNSKILRTIFIALLFFISTAQADIKLDHDFPWSSDPFSDAGAPVTHALRQDMIAKGYTDWNFNGHVFHILWNGQNYYVTGAQYRTKAQNTGTSGGETCSVFIYDTNLKQVAQHDVTFPKADGHVECNGARTLGLAKEQHALLFSIMYYRSNKPLSQQDENAGNDWHYMTVLLPLREQNGKLTIEQDDTCLGNPNELKDAVSAREALTQCISTASSRPVMVSGRRD
jgi:hypothetical protein